MKENPSITQLL